MYWNEITVEVNVQMTVPDDHATLYIHGSKVENYMGWKGKGIIYGSANISNLFRGEPF